MKRPVSKFMMFMMFMSILWGGSSSIRGKGAPVLPGLKKPRSMTLDSTQLYVGENAAVYIYSLDGFKLVKTFGTRGQGPQEFYTLPHIPITVDVSTNNIIVGSICKISYFTKRGDFLKEVKTANLVLYLQPLGSGFLGRSQAYRDGINYFTIDVYDEKLGKLKEVYRMKDNYQGFGKSYKIPEDKVWFRVYDNKILLLGKDNASVDIFDRNLNKLFSLHVDQEKRKIDEKTRNRFVDFIKNSSETKEMAGWIQPKIVVSDYFPVIDRFFVDNDTIYVMTWKRENETCEFFTYDMGGKFLKRFTFPVRYENVMWPYPLAINKGKLYQLVENEKREVWEIHVSEIEMGKGKR